MTSSKVGFAAVTVHDVVPCEVRSVGSHDLVRVTSSWPRTIVTGMCRTRCWPWPVWVRVIIPKRISPSPTAEASSSILNVALPPAFTWRFFGTLILKSEVLDVVSFQSDFDPRTLCAVRVRVILPGIVG